MPLPFRRRALAYLRALAARRGQTVLRLCALACALACAFVAPDVALQRLGGATATGWLAFAYFCSMMFGAAPFLTAGALGAAALTGLARRRAAAASPALLAVLFPGCDCAMNAFAATLRSQPPAVAAAVVSWSGICNPLALATTALILGPKMAAVRALTGAVASGLTAVWWSAAEALPASHDCERPRGYWARFAALACAAVATFAPAAACSAVYLTWIAGSVRIEAPAAAALVGAIMSPCSNADALLARALFHSPAGQLAFIVGAQCLDVRQMLVLRRCFGPRLAARSFCAAAFACVVGCWLSAR